ncbi:hypothetical protein AVEN_186911-1 [Araneus ventricosus]|uniref:Uncharacterized protein n=1 Tax=Araneus ventricosus TaxID=182803 RepID=A0A4Y2N7P8_ARAVE|nr:hypothetical protein AVEN_186911-1 [Araneus ventricosus]
MTKNLGQTLQYPAFNQRFRKPLCCETRCHFAKTKSGTRHHILSSDPASMCSMCNCILTIKHISCICNNFYTQRQARFGAHIVDLIDILGAKPNVGVFSFPSEVKLVKMI